MDERKELARRLRQMAVTTGDLSCLGCGYERGCSVHGCAVLRRASDLLAPAVDINKPIPLEELRAAAAERPVLVFVLCVDEDGTYDIAANYGRTFVAFWDEPGRDE